MRRRLIVSLVAVSSLALWSCSSGSSTTETAANEEPAAEAAPAEGPVTGMTAFWEMYELAYMWANDLQPIYLRSQPMEGVAIENGQAALWQALFVSPSRNEAREFTYRAISEGTDRKGVTPGPVRGWGGPTPKAEPMATGEMKIDSDQAFTTASEDAASWLSRNPGKEVSFYLGKEDRFDTPVWGIVWGEESTGYSSIVSASSGELVNP